MDINYHQVVANMKPEIFKVVQLITERIDSLQRKVAVSQSMNIQSPRYNSYSFTILELRKLLQEIEKDKDNWIPVPKQEQGATITSTNVEVK